MTNGWQSVVGCFQIVRYLISRADLLTSFAPSYMHSVCLCAYIIQHDSRDILDHIMLQPDSPINKLFVVPRASLRLL